MMQFKEHLWIYIFMSLTYLSVVCANQSSIFGGSVQGSRVPSSILTVSGSVTSDHQTTTNIQSSSVVKNQLTSSLEPSFSSEILTSLIKLTSLTTVSVATTRVKRSGDSSERTSSCWFCHLYSTPSVTILPSTSKSSFLNMDDLINQLFKSTTSDTPSESYIKPTSMIETSTSAANSISSTQASTFPLSVISKSVLSMSSVSSNSIESSTSSCWFCHLYSTPSVTLLPSTSKASFLNMDDLINQLFKSTSSQISSESYIEPTSLIKTSASVVNSIASTPASTFPSSVISDSVLSTSSVSSNSIESSTSSCWFCHLYSTPSLTLMSSPSTSKASFLNMDDLINQLFKSTSSHVPSESYVKPTSMIETSTSVVSSIASTPASIFPSSVISKSVLSTSSMSSNSIKSSISCWFCHLYSTPSGTLLQSTSKASFLNMDDLINQLFKSTSSQISSESYIQPTSLIETSSSVVNSIAFTSASTFSAPVIKDSVFSTSSVSRSSTESITSSCWYCHLYSTPSVTASTSSTASKTSLLLIDDLINQLFTSSSSQKPSGSIIKPISTLDIVSSAESTLRETTLSVSRTPVTNDFLTNTVTAKLGNTHRTTNIVTSAILTKSSFSTKSLSPSFESSSIGTIGEISIQRTKTQEMNIISTESSPNMFSASINTEPESLSGKSFSMAPLSALKSQSSVTQAPQRNFSQTHQTSSSHRPISSSSQMLQSNSPKMPQISSSQTLQSISMPTPQSSSSQTFQSISMPTPQSSSSQTLQSISMPTPQSSSSQTFQSIYMPTPQSSYSQTLQSISMPTPQSSSSQTLLSISMPTPQSSSSQTFQSISMSTPQSSSSQTLQSISMPTPQSSYSQTFQSLSMPTPQSSSSQTFQSSSPNAPQSSFSQTLQRSSLKTPQSSFSQTLQSSPLKTPQSSFSQTIQNVSTQTQQTSSSQTLQSSSPKAPQSSFSQTLQISSLKTPQSSFSQMLQSSSPKTQQSSFSQTIQNISTQTQQTSSSQTLQSSPSQTPQSSSSQTPQSSSSQTPKSSSSQTPQSSSPKLHQSVSSQMLQSISTQTPSSSSTQKFQPSSSEMHQNLSLQTTQRSPLQTPQRSLIQSQQSSFSQMPTSSSSQTQQGSLSKMRQSIPSQTLKSSSSQTPQSSFSQTPQGIASHTSQRSALHTPQSSFSQTTVKSYLETSQSNNSQTYTTSLLHTFEISPSQTFQTSSPKTSQTSSSQTLQRFPSSMPPSSSTPKHQSSSSQTPQTISLQTITSTSSQSFSKTSQIISTQMIQSSFSQMPKSSFSQAPKRSSSQTPKNSYLQTSHNVSSHKLQSNYSQMPKSSTPQLSYIFSSQMPSNNHTHIIQSTYSNNVKSSSSQMPESMFSKIPQNSSTPPLPSSFSQTIQSSSLNELQISSSKDIEHKSLHTSQSVSTVRNTIPSESTSKQFSIKTTQITKSASPEITKFSFASELSSQSIMSSSEVTLDGSSLFNSPSKVITETVITDSSKNLPDSLSTQTVMSSLTFTDSPTAASVQSESTITSLLSSKSQRYSDTITKSLTPSFLMNITKTSPSTSLEITKVISSESKKSDNESRHLESFKSSSNMLYTSLTSEYMTNTFKTTSPSTSINELDSSMKPTRVATPTVLDTSSLESETTQGISTALESKGSRSINSEGATPSEALALSIKSTPIISAATQQPKSISSSASSISSFDIVSNTVTVGPISTSPIRSVTISESPITSSLSLLRGIPSPTTLTSRLGLDSISPTPASASKGINSTIPNISTTITSENFNQLNSSFTPSLKVSGTSYSRLKVTETTNGATTSSIMLDSTEPTLDYRNTSTPTVSHSTGLSGNVTFKSEEYISSTKSSLYLTSTIEQVSKIGSILKTSSSQTTKSATLITVAESRTILDFTITLTSSVIGPTTNASSSGPSLSLSSVKLMSSHMSSISSSASLDVISASQNASGSAPSSTSTVDLTIGMPTIEPLTSATAITTTTASLEKSAPLDSGSASKHFTIPKPLNTIGTSSVTFTLEIPSSNLLTTTESLKTTHATVTPSEGQSALFGKNVSSPTFIFPKPLHTVGPGSATKFTQATGTLSPSQTLSTGSRVASSRITTSRPLHTIEISSATTTSVPLSLESTTQASSDLISSTLPPAKSTMQPTITHVSSKISDTSLSLTVPASTVSLQSSKTSGSFTKSTTSFPASMPMSTTKNVEKSSSQMSELTVSVSAPQQSRSSTVKLSMKTLSSSAFVDPTSLSVAMSTTTSSSIVPTSIPDEYNSSITPNVTVLSSSVSALNTTTLASLESTMSSVTPSPAVTSVNTAVLTTSTPVTTSTTVTSVSTAVLTTSTPVTPSTAVTSVNTSVSTTSTLVKPSTAVTSVSTAVLTTSTSMTPSTAVTSGSSAVLTTSTPLNVVNATNAGEEYWIETVLKILQSVDVLIIQFRKDIESRFAVCYKEGFKRLEGKSDSILKRRRRYTQAGDAAVHIQHITRTPNTTTVSVAYTVEKSGTLLEPQAAIDAIDTLDTQELAIILRQVVDVTAEPYIKVVTPAPSTDEDSIGKLWIIGAVAGPVLAIILIVWLVLCIYLKCCRTTITEKQEEEGEPKLTSIKNTETQKLTQFSKAYDNQAYNEIPEQSSRQGDKKGRSYEVNPESEAEYIEAYKNMKVTPVTNADRSKQEPSVTVQNGTTIKDTAVIEGETGHTPQKKKKNRTRNGSIEPLGPGSSDNSPRLKSNSEHSFLLHSSVSGEDEELKGRTDKERKKNKDRHREKQKKKKDDDIRAYLEAQREIDQVLGAPNTLPDVFVENSDSANHAKVSRQDSGVSNEPLSGEETLEEARMKMHQLLDDAFTLISPRESLQENDIRAIQRMQAIARRHGDKISTSSPERKKMDSSSDSKSKISTVHLDSMKDLGQHIRHEPMHFDSGYSNKSYPLETWSPYRASDQVALISMPNTMETKLGGPKGKNKEKDRPTTSKPGRRPAANFETQESKSTGYLEEKYASSSPQPIVLRSKDLASYVNVNKDKQPKDSVKTRQNSLGKYAAMTSLNGDVYLSGSTTTLSKKKDKGLPRGASSEYKDKGVPHSTSSEHKNTGVPRSTSLQHTGKDMSIGDGIELRPLKRKSWATLQQHRGPVPHQKDSDEVDVINDIQPSEQSDDLIKSLRDELQLLKGSFNLDSKVSKKGKKGSGMTEIV